MLIYVLGFRFTTRGIVALVFSVVAAILGMAVIVLYGMAEPVVPGPVSAVARAAKNE